MRVLILGATGLLGHKLYDVLRARCEVWAAARAGYPEVSYLGLFDSERWIGGLDAFDPDSIVRIFEGCRPDVVVNCIGITKRAPGAEDPIVSLIVNSLLPHRLARLCEVSGARFIHVSTDCIFSGRRGSYRESDPSDAEDLYGRSKFLGEPNTARSLTLRTSFVGRELRSSRGLVEWFLGSQGVVHGYRRAVFSGLTTLALARAVLDVVLRHPSLAGIYHVSADPISKYDLLRLMRDAYDVRIEVLSDDSVEVDRSLDGRRFRETTAFVPPPWPGMVREMAEEANRYDAWRAGR